MNKPIILTGNRASGKTTISNLMTRFLSRTEYQRVSILDLSERLIEENNTKLKLLIVEDCETSVKIIRTEHYLNTINHEIQLVFETNSNIPLNFPGFEVIKCNHK